MMYNFVRVLECLKKNNKTEKTFFYCQSYNKKNNEHNGRRCNYYIAECKQVVVLAAVTCRSNLCTHNTQDGGEKKGSCREDGTASTIDDDDDDDGHYCVYAITHAHDILIRDKTYVHRYLCFFFGNNLLKFWPVNAQESHRSYLIT